jgi:L-lactate utilization protein LutB
MDFYIQNKIYTDHLNETLSRIQDIELARQRLTYLRWKVTENLDKLLFEFETNVKKTDANILWAPDHTIAIEYLNKHLQPFNNVRFLKHNAVKKLVNNGGIKVPETPVKTDAIVVGAKFLMANTGNFFCALNSLEEYDAMLEAKKIIVIAGVDSFLASQTDLPIAKQLYSIYETGQLNYAAELMGRPGKPRGMNTEIVLILIDDGRSKLIENPVHRPLCPMQQYGE